MLLTESDCFSRIWALNIGKEYLPTFWLARRGYVIKWIQNPETVWQHQIRAALLVVRFRDELLRDKVILSKVQDTLLIHDIYEPMKWVGDITPHDNIPNEEKKIREAKAIRVILAEHPELLWLWFDMEEGRTLEWRKSTELDKLQAIEQAGEYEKTYPHFSGRLVHEFYSTSVLQSTQIQTAYFLDYAETFYKEYCKS